METVEDAPGARRRWRRATSGPRCRPPAPAARAVRRRAGRPRPGDPAGDHPLAVAQLVRLLPGQHLGPVDPRRAARPPGSASRGCSGPPARRAPSWRPTSWTGWSSCSACPTGSAPTAPGGGVIQDSASSRHAVRAARRPRAGRAGRRRPRRPRGLHVGPGPLRLEKGVRVAGLERRPAPPRRPSTTSSPCAPTLLAAAIAEDLAAGPDAVLRAAPRSGTTSSLAVDPVAAHRRRLRRARASGSTSTGPWRARPRCARAALGERRPRPGRQLRLQPPQVAVHQLRLHLLLRGRPGARCSTPCRSCPSTCATRPASPGAVIDYRDWQVPLGRRFRALKLWFVLRHYGAEGLAPPRPRATWRWPQELAGWVEADERFELAAPPRLSLVCFAPRRRRRGHPARCSTPSTRPGGQYLTHTRLDDRLVAPGVDRPDPHRGAPRRRPVGSPRRLAGGLPVR